MENKNLKQTQQIPKDLKLDSNKRDRGDSFRKQDGGKARTNDKSSIKSVPKPSVTDRGDTKIAVTHKTIPSNNKIAKDKVNERGKKPNDRAKLVIDVVSKVIDADKPLDYKTSGTINSTVNRKVSEKKNISDRVNPRSKVFNSQHLKKDQKFFEKPDFENDHSNLKAGSKEIIAESIKSEVKTESDSKKDKETHRKLLIKTVKTKNDKVYKAVTFTEKKVLTPTVLEISIPNIQAKKKSKLVDKKLEAKIPTVPVINDNKSTSKLSMKEKIKHNRRNRVTERTKRKRLNRCISSPDKFKKVESPPTEVAKWAPSCLNAHTKPYYEAWVNTTLAAITKISKNDKLYTEKENIIRQFQKSLESGVESPEIVHQDYNNEQYTGKIKIKRRHTKSKRQPLITPLLDKDFSIL